MLHPRRAALLTLLGLGVLLAAVSAAWGWTTGRMLAEWDHWRAQAAAQGVQVQSAPPVRAGWPFAADLLLPAVTVDFGLATWRADAVRLRLSPTEPTTLAVLVEGGESLRVASLPPVAITAQALAAAVPLRDPALARLHGVAITATLPDGPVAIGTLDAQFGPAGLQVEAGQVQIPITGLPFGGAIQQMAAHIRATQPVPPAPGGEPWPDARRAAAAWAQSGGQIAAEAVRLLWGPLDATGQFTLGLDAALQPAAIGTLRLTGYHQAVDALVRTGLIAANAGRVATTVLDMMAARDAPAAVDVPLTLRSGVLAMGAIPLARTPPLTWP